MFSVPHCRRPAVAQKRVCLFWRDLSGTVGNSASEQLGFQPAFCWAGCLALSAACCSCLQTTFGSFIHSRARLGFRRGYWILFSYALAGPSDGPVPYLNPALMSTVAHERCVCALGASGFFPSVWRGMFRGAWVLAGLVLGLLLCTCAHSREVHG